MPFNHNKPEEYRVDLMDGKYTYIRYAGGGQTALRHGEEWFPKHRSLIGDNFTAAFGYALEERDAQLEEVVDLLTLFPGFTRGPVTQARQVNLWCEKAAVVLERILKERQTAPGDAAVLVARLKGRRR